MMQHVTAEGTALVKQAEDAASNKKVCALDYRFSNLFLINLFKVSAEKVFHWILSY